MTSYRTLRTKLLLVCFGLFLRVSDSWAGAIYTGYINPGLGGVYWIDWSGEIEGGLYDGIKVDYQYVLVHTDESTGEMWFDKGNPVNTVYGFQNVTLTSWVLYCNGLPIQDINGPIQPPIPPPTVPTEEEDLPEDCTTEPINTRTGNNFFAEPLFTLPSSGLLPGLALHYQSTAGESSLGKGWRHSYDWWLDIKSDYVDIYTGTGEKIKFDRTSENYAELGIYETKSSINWKLTHTYWNPEAPLRKYYLELPGGIKYTFSNAGKLMEIRDKWNRLVTFNYYSQTGCLYSVTSSHGPSVNFSNVWQEAIADWRVKSISIPNGASWTFSYDVYGQFTQKLEHVSGNTYTSSYAYADGYLTNRVNKVGHSYKYDYEKDSYGRCTWKATRLSAGNDRYEHVVFRSWGYPCVTYENGDFSQCYQYNDYPHPPYSEPKLVVYGPAPNFITSNITQRGTTYFYGGDTKDKIKTTVFDNSAGSSWTEWMGYDSAHNITNYSVAYNSSTAVQQLSVEYDPDWNLPVAIQDAQGYRREIVYTNGLPSISRITLSGNETAETVCGYNGSGFLTAITNANHHWMEIGRDALGLPETIALQAGPLLTLKYNALGYVTNSVLPGGRKTSYAVDALGKIKRIDYADNLYETFGYDGGGHLTNYVNRAGRKTSYSYEIGGNLASIRRQFVSTELTVSYGYDQQLNTLSIIDELNRPVERYTLDLQDRPVIVTNLEGQAMSVNYTVGDFVDSVRRFDATVVSNKYTTAGLIETVHYPDETNRYTYLSNGLVRTLGNSGGIISNDWNMAAWLTQTVSSASSVTSMLNYAYDPVGNVTNTVIAISSQQSVIGTSYAYDEAERLTNIVTETQSFIYSYNTNNGLVAAMLCTNTGVHVEYDYDLLDRIRYITWKDQWGATILAFDYQYNAVGMITNRVVQTGISGSASTVYGYDDLDRLTRAGGVEYGYDNAGNRLTKTSAGYNVDYVRGDGNRLASWTATSTNNFAGLRTIVRVEGSSSEAIGTDNRWGQLWVSNSVVVVPEIGGTNFWVDRFTIGAGTQQIVAAIRDQAGNVGYATNGFFLFVVTNGTYAYNAAGCLTNIAYRGADCTQNVSLAWNSQYQLTGASVGSNLVQYGYDVLGRRESRIEGTNVEQYVYDGDQIAADLDSSGSILRSYVWGSGIDNLLSMTVYNATGTNTYYALKDHLNTIHALINASGQVVERYEYDEWGRTTVFNAAGEELPESAVGNRYCFQGREIDWTTGLYCFRARWYDPVAGRWLSNDPIGISGGLNMYAFCGNNPVNFVDPMGLKIRSFEIIGAKAAVVFGLSGAVSFVWDDRGNKGFSLTGGVGTGVYLGGNLLWNGVIKRALDVASRYSEQGDCNSTIYDLNGFGTSASGGFIIGGSFDLDHNARFTGLDLGIGGAVFKTGTVVIPLPGSTPTNPERIRTLPAFGWRP